MLLKKNRNKKEKDIPNKVFNPNNVIDPKKAESIAVANIGGDAISKGWKLEADNGKVQYEVTIYHNDETDGLVQQGVIIDAVSGDIITRTLPEKVIIPDEEDDGSSCGVNNSYKLKVHIVKCAFFFYIVFIVVLGGFCDSQNRS